MSKQLYDKLPQDSVTRIDTSIKTVIRVANGDSVNVIGSCFLSVHGQKGKTKIFCYILEYCSHPLICGLNFLIQNKIVMDFDKCISYSKNETVKLSNSISIPPRKEMILNNVLPNKIPIGTLGVCVATKFVQNKGLLGARILLTNQPHRLASLRLYNPTDSPIFLRKGSKIATFMPCDNNTVLHKFDCNTIKSPITDPLKVDKFVSDNFNLNNTSHLSADQVSGLKDMLYKNKDVFVTKDNPSLGKSNVIKHTIKLKPNYQEKHIRPYRLPPEKR